MTSRARVLVALCLALAVAVPNPAATMAADPDASTAGSHKSGGPGPVGKGERPTRGQAAGRKAEPFAAGSTATGGSRAPTRLEPRMTAEPSAPAAVASPDMAALDTPATAFFLDGDVNSGPGGGVIKLYTEADTDILLMLDNPGAVRFAIQEIPFPQADWWYLDLYAPDGEDLVPGTYEGATRAGFNEGEEPGLDFAGNGVGCNQVTGRFIIHELTRGAGGELTSLSAEFESHCEGGPDATFGEVRFNSGVPLQAFTLSPHAIDYGSLAVGLSDSRSVTIDNLGATSLGLAGFSIAGPDASFFEIVSETCPTDLAQGVECSVTVRFEPGVAGVRAAELVIDDDSNRGAHDIALAGTGTTPGAAGASGKSPAEIVSIGTGITDAGHEDFYICSASPCIEPPDPNVAVGPDHVVQTAGALIRVTNRFGGAPLTADIFSWFAQPDDIDGFSDATVAYHAATDRYFGASTSWYCGADPIGFLDVGVSATGDPSGVWWIYSFYFPETIPTSPIIGLSSDKLAIGATEVNVTDVCNGSENPSFIGSSVTVIDAADLAAIPDTIYYWGSGPDASVRAWRPASSPTSSSGTLHLVAGLYGTSAANIGYASVVGSVTPFTIQMSGVADLTYAGIVPGTFQGSPPVDPGGPIGTASNALPGPAVTHGNRVAFAVDHPCTPPGDSAMRVCVRVVELSTSANLNVLPSARQDVFLAEKGLDLFQGGVAYSAAGDLHVVSAVSSATRPVGVRHVYERADDQPGTFSKVASIITGKAPYTGEAWGDTVVLAQDPVDAFAVWQGHEYASPDGRWATRVTQMRLPGATYHPLNPKRLLDTRFGNGLSGQFLTNAPRTFQVTGREGIPANAIAVTGNLSVTGQTSAGYAALTPAPTANPPTSTINFPLGDTRGNNVTLSLGTGGRLSAVFKGAAGAKTHLIFDVTGYFVRNNTGSTYVPIEPVRLLNTKNGNGLPGPFVANEPRTWQIAGRGGVPMGAKAISANLAVLDQTGAGYVALTPTPTADPPTSSINFPLGDVRANGVTVPLAPDGTVSGVYKALTGKTTNLVLDVTGYYVADLSGARFVPLNPARTLDSRFNVGLSGTFKSSVPKTLKIDGRRGIPNDAAAITGNLTIVGQTGGGFVSITTAPTATPSTSTLNAPPGDVRGNGITVPIAADGTDSLVYVSGAGKVTHLVLDLTGYFR